MHNHDGDMNLEESARWGKLAGWAGAGLCVLAFLALLDGLIGQYREPESLIKLLPGQTAEINGPLLEEVKNIRELTYLGDSDLLTLSFAAVHKGYFLGGDLWRGQIKVSPRLAPGEYHLTVVPRSSTSKQATPAFRVVVFPDALSLRRSSASLIRRYAGVSPWAAAALCLPGILLAFATVFRLNQKRELLLARQGLAEIYRVIRGDGVFEIHFGLGTAQGLQPGRQLRVLNREGRTVGLARVEKAAATDAVALVAADREIKPGFMVSREI